MIIRGQNCRVNKINYLLQCQNLIQTLVRYPAAPPWIQLNVYNAHTEEASEGYLYEYLGETKCKLDARESFAIIYNITILYLHNSKNFHFDHLKGKKASFVFYCILHSWARLSPPQHPCCLVFSKQGSFSISSALSLCPPLPSSLFTLSTGISFRNVS